LMRARRRRSPGHVIQRKPLSARRCRSSSSGAWPP
jgi:hypothetical protein